MVHLLVLLFYGFFQDRFHEVQASLRLSELLIEFLHSAPQSTTNLNFEPFLGGTEFSRTLTFIPKLTTTPPVTRDFRKLPERILESGLANDENDR